jgi:hypothetical protein
MKTVLMAMVAGLVLAGCAAGNGGASPGYMNSKCPMKPDCNQPLAVERDHNGQKVGFCCAGCVRQWEQLSAADRDARLKAVK